VQQWLRIDPDACRIFLLKNPAVTQALDFIVYRNDMKQDV